MKHVVTIIKNFRYLCNFTWTEVKKLTNDRLLGKYLSGYVVKTNVIDKKASLETLDKYKKDIKWTN